MLVFKRGANVRFPITETTERVYRRCGRWRRWAAFSWPRATRAMLPRGRGNLLFTGATAACAAAAGSRPLPELHALRALAPEHGAQAQARKACMWRMW